VARFGDVVLVEVGALNAYLVSDPELIRQILLEHHTQTVKGRETKRLIPYIGNGLLTTDGEEHRRQRRMIQPVFHRTVVAGYADTIAQYAQQVALEWQDHMVVDMSAAMAHLTMAMATKTLLDLNIDAQVAATLYRDLRTTLAIYSKYLGLPFDVLIKLPLPATRQYYAALHRLDQTLLQRIAEHRVSGQRQSDLLTLLLDAHTAGDDVALTSPEVRDQIMTLFFAGHETLSSALPWAWYYLAQAPEIAATLRKEVDQVLHGRLPVADDMPRLPYTTQVLQETLRLSPPIIALSRRVIEPFAVGDYLIPVNGHLYMSQYVVQRDARWWPDPLRFHPDRFAPGAAAHRPRFRYFPFGGGPRQCIGESFALLEGTIALATIAQHWEMEALDATPPALSSNIITLRPKRGISLRVHRRNRIR
jgi:cytochrome P450